VNRIVVGQGDPRRPRTTLRWRLTLVFGGVTFAVGLTLLVLSIVLVDRAARQSALSFDPRLFYTDPRTGESVSLQDTAQRIQDAQREEAKRQLYKQGLLSLALLGAGGVAVTYVLSGRVLRPLQAITATAQRLSAEQLDERIDLAGPDDELKELADTFDAMLGRLEASFATQQRFVADASHELRTPLAVMRTEVDVALADPNATVEELRASAIVVRAATERADRLVDSLLLLARSDALAVDGLPEREPVDLAALAAAGLRAVRSDVEELGLRVDATWGHAPVRGDAGLLERLAGNLVENAVRHNVPGGFVQASAGVTDDGRSWLTVANSGAVIAPDDIEALFEPFRRHGQARTARRGAGLGLSIVRAVARAHGGTVEAFPRSAGGLVVRVDLPADTSPRVAPAVPAAPAR
jgi:signal transduction histidine kinase